MTEENNDNNTSSLAGAHCPNCQEVCVYEVSEELARSEIETIQISCHACQNIFKTKLPYDKRLPPREAPQQLAVKPIEDDPVFDEDIQDRPAALHDEVMDLNDADMPLPRTAKASGRRKYTYIAGGVVAMFIIGGIMMVKVSRDMRDNALAGLEEAPQVVINTPQAPEAPAPAPEPVSEVTEAAPALTGPEQFEVTDRGYTMTTNDLGTVMNIKVSVLNKGNAPAKPQRMVLHLLSAEGVILMTWPMMNSGAPERDLIPPQSTRQYSAQLIEPPQQAKVLEVEIK